MADYGLLTSQVRDPMKKGIQFLCLDAGAMNLFDKLKGCFCVWMLEK